MLPFAALLLSLGLVNGLAGNLKIITFSNIATIRNKDIRKYFYESVIQLLLLQRFYVADVVG